MPTRLRWCGVRRLARPLNQSTLSVTWMSSSTATLVPPPMFEEPCHVSSLPYGSFATYVDMLQMTASVVVSFVHSRLDYGNFILVGLPAISSTTPRPSLTLQLVWCFDVFAATTWPMSSRYYAGYPTSPGTGEFQTGADGISCAEWHGAGVFESTRSRIRPARSSPSSVGTYTRTVRSVISSDNHWPSLVSCWSRSCLEHFACPCPVITFYCNLSLASEDILVPTVISGHTCRSSCLSSTTLQLFWCFDFVAATTWPMSSR